MDIKRGNFQCQPPTSKSSNNSHRQTKMNIATCSCPNCAQKIEFDAADTGAVVACPNCEKEMKLNPSMPPALAGALAQIAAAKSEYSTRPTTHICKDCGAGGNGGKSLKGSLTVAVGLWVFGIFLASIWSWLAIVPAIVYSFWRSTTRAIRCKACGSNAVIPVNSPAGREFAERYHKPSVNL